MVNPQTLFNFKKVLLQSKEHYDTVFEQELLKLNPAQLEAVNQVEGPVLVIAGPGTGKTHLLAARIGKILKSTDTQPYNILCLTYTEAGTIAMRQRLLEFIGPEAYRVNIYTFHAFCNEIIQRYPDYFGNRELEPISELETAELLMQLLDGLDSSNPLKRKKGNIYYDVPLLKDLFRKMKEESWSPEKISMAIDEYLDDLPNREEYIYKRANTKMKIEKGDVKQHLIDIEKEKMEKLREASRLFPVFRNMMEQSNRYDYNDMILWVLEAFKNDEEFLRIHQEKYLYFLVDEFQDTNGAQSEILHLLINYWDKPNVFAVGDDDQSIFEFQGARIKNILDFYRLYERDIKVVVLEDNYRSSQHILNCSKALIDNNNMRLINKISGLTKNLIARNEDVSRISEKPIIKKYFNIKHEEAAILKELEILKEKGVPLSEVAVIYYRHRQAEEIINLAEKKGIPYKVVKKSNILELPFVSKLLWLIEYIGAEVKYPYGGEYLLYKMMHFSFFGIRTQDAAKVVAFCGRQRDFKLREFISDADKIDGLSLPSKEAILRFGKNINHWIGEASNLTFQMLFERVINSGGILKEVMNSPDKTWLMQVLITFFDFIKEESIKNPDLTVNSFLETINKMKTNEIELSVNKTVYEENGVNFLTAHSSKGREFQYVFIIGATNDLWEKKGRHYSYALPDTLTYTNEENQVESARRVFYVAMTRAKKHLQISYSKKNNKDKELEKALYLAEVERAGDVNVVEEHLSNDQITEVSYEALKEAPLQDAALLDTQFINTLLEQYSMSITHLNKYLKCPVTFYYENIIRVPAAKNEAMAFGSAIHFALKRLFDKMLASGNGTFPGKNEFVEDFLWEMKRNKGSFNAPQFERRKELGREILPEYYDKWVNSWNKIVVTEFDIRNVEMDGIPLNGKLDKLEFDKHEVNVTDYKTGSAANGLKKLKPPDEKDPVGGDYWRQVIFYKILMDELKPKRWTMVSGEIDFIEKDDGKVKDFVKVKVPVTKESIIIVKNQIKDTWQKIMNHEFSKGCGKDDCYWCGFVKDQFALDIRL